MPAAKKPAVPTPTPAAVAPPAAYAPYEHRLTAAAGVDRLLSTEWLLTNGLGGFAMGTASGVPSRRYHGLLVAALSPPVGRVMTLNALVDSLTLITPPATKKTPSAPTDVSTAHAELSTFRFSHAGTVLHPDGLSHLESFQTDLLTARWTYALSLAGEQIRVIKQLQLLRDQDVASITYRIERSAPAPARAAVRLTARPLLSLRDMHGLIRQSWSKAPDAVHGPRQCRVFRPSGTSDGGLSVHLQSDAMDFTPDPQWWHDFHYALDAQRQQDCLEDLHSPGTFELALGVGQTQASGTIQVSLKPMAMADGAGDGQRTRARRASMYAAALASRPDPLAPLSQPDATTIAALVDAADEFVVRRQSAPGTEPDQSSIIAGYPWFADWGRDTCISLPGLMLSTGRFDEARRALTAFASHRRNGIVPNVFDDRTGVPEYNTVDASLWFVHACCAYARRSGDRATFDGVFAPACLDVIACYRKRTDFNIAMDPMDKLITAGTESTQLTWMDAKRDGVAFTPRHGKCVEINALWYSALCELATALGTAGGTAAANLTDLAQNVAKSFRNAFWDAQRSCLYDRLTPSGSGERPGWTPVSQMRPNQIFAVSLPHSPLSTDQMLGVIAAVKHHLLTPMGLRTLGPDEPGYARRYEGNMFDRDRAYHNGTVWPWLLGPYAQALLRAGGHSPEAKKAARDAVQPALEELFSPRGGLKTPILGNCLGQLAEVYDADQPQRPQGCTAQAWSVAELLRALTAI